MGTLRGINASSHSIYKYQNITAVAVQKKHNSFLPLGDFVQEMVFFQKKLLLIFGIYVILHGKQNNKKKTNKKTVPKH